MSKYIWLVLAWIATMIVAVPVTYCYNVIKYSTMEHLLHLVNLLLIAHMGAIVFFPTGVFLVLGVMMFMEGRKS